MGFSDRYGPWAVVAGASEGMGAAWSRAIAARGVNVVLVARGRDKLEQLAAGIRAAHPVQVRVHPTDLGAPDVVAHLAAGTDDVDVGLVVYNACYSVIGEFLDLPDADKLTTLDVNVRGPTLVASHFGARLRARGKGGLVLMSSMSGFQGSAMVGTYAATKAFNTVLGEMLWEEWKPHGVDVLVCAAGATLTPNFERITPERKRKGAFPMTPDAVVAEAIEALGTQGPTFIPGRMNRVVQGVISRLLPRGRAVHFISDTTRKMYEEGS